MDIYLRNQNIINGLDLDTPIYKYIKLKYVLQMVCNRQLYFDKMSSWADVYENFFLKEKFLMPEGTVVSAESLISGVFGQCWSSLEESDAMWRIYSAYDYLNRFQPRGGEDGNQLFAEIVSVRIKTSARKLFEATYLDNMDAVRVYIGSVDYKSEDEINDFIRGIQPLKPIDINLAWTHSMFIKRNPFAHESEVRSIVLRNPDDPEFGNQFLLFNINPADFIEEVVIDPRLRPDDFKYVNDKLIQVGIDSDIIRQSQLYSFEQQDIMLE